MNQNQQVLTHIKKRGTITQLEAVKYYNIYRLSARINELKKEYPIKKRWKQSKKKRFAQYYL